MTPAEAVAVLAMECGINCEATDHVSGFTNEYGEVLIFHQRPRGRTGTLYHSDLDWEPVAVTDDSITYVKDPIPVIVVGGWILSEDEVTWLARTLVATSGMRGPAGRR